MRFPLEVIRAVRRAVGPDLPIGLRSSIWDGRDGTPRPFRKPEDLTVFLGSFVDAGIDVFNDMTRHFAHPEFEGSDRSYAGWVKELTGLPVISGGGVGLDVSLFDSLAGKPARTTAHEGFDELTRRFDRGDFDLVSLGRTILTDPEWLIKVRQGRYQDLRPTLSPADIFSGPPTNRPPTEKTQSLPVRSA
jgi:2,4-dienoyl-CoA reductase-like NADH-dependent reductase (Old Yellow Enzyme family)